MAGNAANNNGNESGDKIYWKKYDLHPDTPVNNYSAQHQRDIKKLKISPNPARDFIRILSSGSFITERIIFFGLDGRKLYESSISEDGILVLPSYLSTGYYLVRIESGNFIYPEKMIIIK